MSFILKKVLKVVFKVILVLIGIGLLGYLAYLSYLSVSYRPSRVKISNVTDSSFTVSWVTEEPMKGVVYYKEKDSFLPGPLAWIGSSKAVDDRDYARVQNLCVEDFNKEASNTVGEDFVVNVKNLDCENVEVKNYEKYYTHHVTLKDLDSEKEYYFRVGDSFFYWEGESSSSITFSQLEEMKEPTPIFGKIVNEEGVYTDDSIIYATFENGREGKDSILYSNVTNEEGGWYLDGSYIRTEGGDLVGMESQQDLFRANGQYMNYGLSDTYEWVFGYFGGNYPDIVVRSSGSNVIEENPVSSKKEKVLGIEDIVEGGEVLAWEDNCSCAGIKATASTVGWGNAYQQCANQCNSGVISEKVLGEFGHANDSTAIAGNLSVVASSPIRASEVENAGGFAYIEGGVVMTGQKDAIPTEKGTTEGDTSAGASGSDGYQAVYSITVDKYSGIGTIGSFSVNMGDYIDDLKNSCNRALNLDCKICIGNGSDLGGCHVVISPTEMKFENFVKFLIGQIESEITNESTEVANLSEYNTHLINLEPLSKEYLKNIAVGKEFKYNSQKYSLKQDSSGNSYFEIDGDKYALSDILSNCNDGAISCDQTEINYLKSLQDFQEDVESIVVYSILTDSKIQAILEFNGGFENSICVRDGGCQCAAVGSTVEKGDAQSLCSQIDTGENALSEGSYLELDTDGHSVCALRYCVCKYTYDPGEAHDDYQKVVSTGEECPDKEPPIVQTTEGYPILTPSTASEGEMEKIENNQPGLRCLENFCACGDGLIKKGYICTVEMTRIAKNGKKKMFRKESGVCDDPDGCKCYNTAGINFRWDPKTAMKERDLKMGDYCFAGDITRRQYKESAKNNRPKEIKYDEYCDFPNYCICEDGTQTPETKLCVDTNNIGTSILKDLDNPRTLSNLLKDLLKSTISLERVFAASDKKDEYTYFLPEYGFYDLEIEGMEEIENMPALKGNERHLFYVETNGKEGLQIPKDPDNPQPGEDLILKSNALKIRYKSTANSQTLEIKKGINIISFDYIPRINKDKPTKSSDLLKFLQKNGYTSKFMAYFDAGRWKGVLADDKEISGTDFAILPGRGYLLRSLTEGSIEIPGYDITDSVPLPLSSGWNLVGIHGYTRAYTAGTFIESINKMEGLTADNVSWWPTSKGRYEGLQVTDGKQYGLDFPIIPFNGYFVRIVDFKPESNECRSIIWHERGDLHGYCGHSRNIF